MAELPDAMPPSQPMPTQATNPILAWAYRRFFDGIKVDPEWIDAVRAAARTGTVVYVLRNLSLVDLLALDHITKRYDLPQIRFANDVGLWMLQPLAQGLERLLAPRTQQDHERDLRGAIEADQSAAIFLKRTRVLGTSFTGRGLLEGDPFLRALFSLQRERSQKGEKPIVLLPLLFVWSRDSDKRTRSLADAFIGTREWPNALRSIGELFLNHQHVQTRVGVPIHLAEFLAKEQPESTPTDRVDDRIGDRAPVAVDRDRVLVRRAIYLLLRRLERERRIIVGPAIKPSDRLIDEILRLPRVRRVIEELAGEGNAERMVFEERARTMLRDIAATLEPEVIRFMDGAMAQLFSRLYDGIELDREGLERIREASKHGTLILLPSHKSHADYLLISHVLKSNDMPVPLIASGDNLAFFPLGSLFRRAGAFFIRRKIGNDRLYTAVLTAYLHKILQEGFSIEFFIEGQRSRSGKVLPPKLGLLGMVVDYAYAHPDRPVYFVPISIGYERVVEAKSHVAELQGAEKERESLLWLLRAVPVLRERYGRLSLQVGKIITLEDARAELERSRANGGTFVSRRAVVSRLGHRIVYEINQATAVTQGSLTALALLSHVGRGLNRQELERRCDRFLEMLHRSGARLQPGLRAPGGGISRSALDAAIGLFASAGWLETEAGDESDPAYLVPDEKRIHIDLSKNAIVHFFVHYGLLSLALLRSGNDPVAVSVLRERIRTLARLLKYEFTFRNDASYDSILDETLERMVAEGLVARVSSGDDATYAAPDADAHGVLALYASTLDPFLEGYRVAARALSLLTKNAMPEKELVRRALSLGKRMFIAGEIARREAIQRPLVENALSSFLDLEVLARADGKLVLSPSFATMDTVKAVERRITSYLLRGGDRSSSNHPASPEGGE